MTAAVGSSRGIEGLLDRLLRPDAPPGALRAEYPLAFAPADGSEPRLVAVSERGAPAAGCATLVRDLVLPTGTLRVGLIGSVATAPEFRRRGLASRVLDAACARLEDEGCVAALLWADEPGFYERRGFVEVGSELVFRVDAACAARLPRAELVRAASSADVSGIAQLYERHARRARRSLDELAGLLSSPGVSTLVCGPSESPTAYACLGRGADFIDVIHDWGGADVPALVRAHAEARGRTVFVVGPIGEPVVLDALRRAGAYESRGHLGMARALGAAALARALAAHGGAAFVAAEPGAAGVVARTPTGDLLLAPCEALRVLLGRAGDRGEVQRLERRLRRPLPTLPLAPYLFGLDSI